MKRKVIFVNIGGNPMLGGGGMGFTEGGLAHAVSALCELASDHDVKVLCPNVGDSEKTTEVEYREIPIVSLGVPWYLRWMKVRELSLTEAHWRTLLHWPTAVARFVQTWKYLKCEKPDVVIANGVFASVLLRFARGRIPVRAGVIHHLYHTRSFGSSPGHRLRVVQLLERIMLNLVQADVLGVVSPLVGDELARNGFSKEDVVVVGNGVDIDRYPFVEHKTPNSVVYVGRLRGPKRVGLLVDMIALVRERIPDVRLHLVGDGPKGKEVAERVVQRGVEDNVVMHGFLPEEEKVDLLSSCAVYVSQSEFEGFGIPLVEAMASGTVPVVSDIPAHRFVFQGREVGYLVGSVEEMAERVVELLRDERKRSAMAAEGRRLVEERWTWKQVGERYRELLRVGECRARAAGA
ncbi:MAG: glycosyltransferase family 4 protein [Chloroflexota bacterium]